VLVYPVVKVVVVIAASLAAVVSVIAIWRFRGVLNWNRSLRKEIKHLSAEAEKAKGKERRALNAVLTRCRNTGAGSFSELISLGGLYEYVCDISACFHPDADRPELQITLGQSLRFAQEFAGRLETILTRPGFRSMRRVRIRHIRRSYEHYERLSRSPWIKFLNRTIRNVFRLNMIVLADPLSLAVYVSNRLTILLLTRCLLLDVYLYVGRSAVRIYGQESEPLREMESGETLEQVLQDLEGLRGMPPPVMPPSILEVRRRLAGYSTMLGGTPGIRAWKAAVVETATLVAKRYFPDSDRPLEEVALGPLLERGRIWLNTLSQTENYPVVKRFHGVKLNSMYTAKSFTDRYLTQQVRTAAKTGFRLYRWTRRSFKLYRLIRRTSPVAVSIQIGWIMARRGIVRYFYGYAFDRTYRELEIVYRDSTAAFRRGSCHSFKTPDRGRQTLKVGERTGSGWDKADSGRAGG